MTYTNAMLEKLVDVRGPIGGLALLALHQREHISTLENKPERADVSEKQVRDLTAENKRLRRRIAELESVTA